MKDYTLTVVDTTGIQNYVFATNNLKQIIGASHLVNCATRDWVHEGLNTLKFGHNIIDLDADTPDKVYKIGEIEKGDFEVEVIYCGGGNAVLIFGETAIGDSITSAKKFAGELSLKALDRAHGLGLVIAHQVFSFNDAAIGGKGNILEQVFEKIVRQKANPLPDVPFLGLSVTAQCVYTDKPANEINPQTNQLISKEVKRKLENVEAGKKRLIKYFSNGSFYDPPDDIDQLGQTEGEKSYIAVVHCDGNGMGTRIENIGKFYSSSNQNRGYIAALRQFSFSIKAAAKEALNETINQLNSVMVKKHDENGKEYWEIGDTIKLSEFKLPIRPVIFGGDDLTFICDGRLGLSLTAFYLNCISRKILSDHGTLACRAGVAVVKSHFPVARAYGLAEELAGSAKKTIWHHEEIFSNQNQAVSVSAMDWHFAVNGLVTGLWEIREQEYHVKHGSLIIRPLVIAVVPEQCNQQPGTSCQAIGVFSREWQTWKSLEGVLAEFTGGKWYEHRSKLKNFRNSIRKGDEAFEIHMKTHRMPASLPDISEDLITNENAKTKGWIDEDGKGYCAYFDALEALDFYVPIDYRYQEEIEE